MDQTELNILIQREVTLVWGTRRAFPAYIHLGDCYTNTPLSTHVYTRTPVHTHNDPLNQRIKKLKGNLNQVTCVMLQKNYLLTHLKL